MAAAAPIGGGGAAPPAAAPLLPSPRTAEETRWDEKLAALQASLLAHAQLLATATHHRAVYHNTIETVIDAHDAKRRAMQAELQEQACEAHGAAEAARQKCVELDVSRDARHADIAAIIAQEAAHHSRCEALQEAATLAAEAAEREEQALEAQRAATLAAATAAEVQHAQEELMKSETYGLSEEAARIVSEGNRAKHAAQTMRQRSIATEIERREKFSKYEELKGTIRVYCRVKGSSAFGSSALPPSSSTSSASSSSSSSMGSSSAPAAAAAMTPSSEYPAKGARFSFPDARTTKRELFFEQQRENATSTGVRRTSEPFTFDRVYTPADGQREVFEDVGPLVDCAVDGYAVCIMAYGQTGSGKTYTMEGPDIHSDAHMGVTPRAVKKVFDRAEALMRDGWQYRVTCSFVEIYNESVRDLLTASAGAGGGDGAASSASASAGPTSSGPSSSSRAASGSSAARSGTPAPPTASSASAMTSRGVQPAGSERVVTTPQQVHRLLEQAVRNRSVAKTNMNERSSRSHCLFTMHIEGSNAGLAQRSAGTLCLVDLAGSERVSDSGVQGVQFQEAVNINKSLQFLGRCISGLSSGGGSAGDWRACRLTQLLQQYLLGKVGAKVLMFANVSDREEHASETMNSMRFATAVNKTSVGPAKKRVVPI